MVKNQRLTTVVAEHSVAKTVAESLYLLNRTFLSHWAFQTHD